MLELILFFEELTSRKRVIWIGMSGGRKMQCF
jgi:hypothetical protein